MIYVVTNEHVHAMLACPLGLQLGGIPDHLLEPAPRDSPQHGQSTSISAWFRMPVGSCEKVASQLARGGSFLLLTLVASTTDSDKLITTQINDKKVRTIPNSIVIVSNCTSVLSDFYLTYLQVFHTSSINIINMNFKWENV